MILVIDNYDSFVYNLARYVEKLGFSSEVHRNDKVTIEDIEALAPEAIIISPGPCTPKEAGISIELVQKLGSRIPILGVCLGHQAIGEAYGGKTVRAAKPVHGKSATIEHDGSALFQNLPSPMEVGRYHSLVTDVSACKDIEVTALSSTNEIMAIQHTQYPVFGVQFHPESVLTKEGIELVRNFILLAKDWHIEQERAA